MKTSPRVLILALLVSAGCSDDGGSDPDDGQLQDAGNADSSDTMQLDAAAPGDAGSAQADAKVDAAIDQGGFSALFPNQKLSAGKLALNATHLFWIESNGIARMSLSEGMREVVATDQVAPSHLHLTNDELYWINSGRRGTSQNVPSSIVKAKLDGTEPQVLADNLLKGNLFRTFVDIQSDASSIYVLETGTPQSLYNDGAIQKLPKVGGAMTAVVSGLRSARHLLHDDTHLFVAWSNVNNDGSIDAYNLDGTGLTALSPAGRGLGDVLQIGDEIWWSDVVSGARIKHVSKTMSGSKTFWEDASASALSCFAADDTHLYYSLKTATGYALYKRPRAGGEAVRVAWGPNACKSLVVGNTELYWSDEDGELQRSMK